MPSFDSINYSLRPSKHIERSLIFEGIRSIKASLGLAEQIYIGFGSVWFVDFQLAHRLLGVRRMWSIEENLIGQARALYNRPYRTISIAEKSSHEAIPELITNSSINISPWIVWLDYDDALSESMIQDLQLLVESSPPNSIILTTFSATAKAYGKPNQRVERLKTLFGAVAPASLSKDDCIDENITETLLRLTSDFLVSVAANARRPGGFVPAFCMSYRDTATMVTVGGILPNVGAVPAVRQVVGQSSWPGIQRLRIVAPPLTLREAAALQSQLPRTRRLNRRSVQKLGFDLTDEQIATYERYYLHYPCYAQITL